MQSAWGIVCGAVLLITGPAVAQQCAVGTGDVVFNSVDRLVVGSGARGPSCTSTKVLKVKLMQDRSFWFDRELVQQSVRVRNGQLIVRYRCSGSGSMRVYIEADDGSQKRQSSRFSVHYCG